MRGPSPYGEGERFFIVARGPVPRERWIMRALARDRPSPYGEGSVFFIVARGPVPRDRWSARAMASLLHRDREVSPTGMPYKLILERREEGLK